MKAARWLLPLVSLLVVAAFTWFDLRGARAGPGPLHSAHAAIPALQGGAHCEACHEPGAGVAAKACTSCHAAIGNQLAAGTGLHGQLGDACRCERCHSEHHGDDAPLIPPHAFTRAGVADVAQYDHRHVGFTLTGAHRALSCTRCHEHADDVAPPAGGRFLGLSQRCTSCHVDHHEAAFGGDCGSCHGQELPWSQAPGFAHERLPLTGAHAKVACATCHAAGSAHDVAAERRGTVPPRACAQCHADPHGGRAGGELAALRLPASGDCARCHDATAWSAARPSPEQHAACGYPLHGPHAAAACAACHGDRDMAPRWTEQAPAANDCAACHGHSHTAALLATARGCSECHMDGDATFHAARLTNAQHAATGFVLAPPHAAIACARCHVGATWSERFPGRASDDCRACHRDPHAGQFTPRNAARTCTECHDAQHFRPHHFGLGAHEATAFPLTGAHTAVGCDRCHVERGGTRTFAGTATSCASCHHDVHAGRFDQAGRPANVGERTGCARCHDVDGWTPVGGAFDHTLWTGHELRGAHVRAACSACHPPANGAAGTPRLGRAAGTTCASCHADPHAGQFAAAAGAATDCARCHGEVAWRELAFDHRRDSRFVLDATHRTLACSRCHVAQPVADRLVVRYRPLGTKCGDCHRLGGRDGAREGGK
jgi:hypothetical protein